MTLAKIGGNYVISDLGTPGNGALGSLSPAVAWNSTDNEYLVVWHGDDASGDMVVTSGYSTSVGDPNWRIAGPK